MLNNADISDGVEAGEVVDVDGMAVMIGKLRGEEGVTVVKQGELFGQVWKPVQQAEARRVQSPIVPARKGTGNRKALYGGKIEPGQWSLLAEADERFRCGG